MRAVLIGCGAISQNHASILKEMKGRVDLVALCDTVPENAKVLMETVGLDLPVYTDYREMFDQVMPDAVHICTPHFLHAQMAIDALDRGIHVFLEKPAAMTPRQLAELEEAEKRSKATLCVCFQNRFLTCNQTAMEKIRSAEAGKILGARAFVTWYRGGEYYTESPWRGKLATEGGSVLMNQSIHTLDLLLWFLGEPKTVDGAIGNYQNTMNETEDTAHLYMTFPQGQKALFYATNTYCKSAKIEWEVVCENMTLRSVGHKLFINDEPVVTRQEGSNAGKAVWGKGHSILIGEFYRALEEGKESPVPLSSAAVPLRAIWELFRKNGVRIDG